MKRGRGREIGREEEEDREGGREEEKKRGEDILTYARAHVCTHICTVQ